MIEINLLPQELKVKLEKAGKISWEPKYLLYLIPLVFAVLISAHVYLACVSIAKNIHLSVLNSKWSRLNPQRELLNNLKKEYETTLTSSNLMKELDRRRLNCSERLNRLSLDVPSGIWFNEISLSQKEFVLKASVVSLEKEEMSLIKRFMDTLKTDTRFLEGFSSLELGLLQKKSIGGYDIVDFTLTATKLKTG